METNKKIEELINQLLEASQAYYQGVDPTMTDDEYDQKIAYLRNVVSFYDEFKNDERVNKLLEGDVAGGSTPEGNLVNHPSPMLSLGKANSMDEVRKYVDTLKEKGSTGFKLQAKLDGYAISAIYQNGYLVQVSTRGDGSVGQNMSYLIDNPEIDIIGLPRQLHTDANYELRGELFLRNSQFDDVNKARETATGETFKNSRNAVVGITKKAEQGLGYHAELTFSTYTLMQDDKYVNMDALKKTESSLVLIDDLSFDEWKSQGGQGNLITSIEMSDIDTKIDEFGKFRPNFDIPTDGVVLKPFNEAYFYETMGHTAHHPLAFIAFKYPAVTEDTEVLSFNITVGKTGKLTPIALVKPVNILGTTIQHVSCSNFNWVYTHNLRVGSTVSVGRANDVIPKIMNVIIPGENALPEVPTVCPECGTKLVSDDDETPAKTIKCPNDDCPSRLFFQMRSIVGKQGLDIDGLDNVFLQKLVDEEYITGVESLFALTASSIEDVIVGYTEKGNPRKLGKVRAKKIVNNINEARLHTPAYKMLNSLGFLNLGPATAKKLLQQFGSIKAVINATEQQLKSVEGFGDKRIKEFIDYQDNAKDLYERLLTRNVVMNEPEIAQITGQSFSISGNVPEGFKNRNEFVDYMQSQGWTYDASPTKDTTVMFGDPNGSSSKIKKALKNGTRIIASPDEL